MTLQRTAALLAAACLLGGSVGAQAPVPDKHVSLRVEGRTVGEIVQFLRDETGANIVVLESPDAPSPLGERTIESLELTEVPWREALEIVAELAGAVVEERDGGILTVEDQEVVSFVFEDQDIRDVINTIAQVSGANIVVAPEVSGTLSVRLTDVPWRRALEVAVKTLGYTIVEEDHGILRVVDPLSLQAQMETAAYQFRYLRPKSRFAPEIESEFLKGGVEVATGDMKKDFPVIEALRRALTPAGDLDFIPAQNVIVVRDTAQVHSQIRSMISQLDIEPAQIFVDAKFVSTTNEDIFNLGVDYGDTGPTISGSLGQIPISLPFDLGEGGWDDLIIASGSGEGPFTFSDDVLGNAGDTFVPETIFGALNFTGITATLRLLQRDVRSEVVQAPKLMVLDGEAGTIFVGETIRYAEAKSEQGQAGGLQLSVQEAANSPVEVGFQLLVIPHVIPGSNRLTMEVIPKETSLSGQGNPTIAPPGFEVFTVGASGLEGTIALPRKRSSTIVTSMLVESGQPVLVGGLATDTEIERHQQVPFLGSIPFLGELFKHRDESVSRRALLVFLTPTIVRSPAESRRLIDREIGERRDDYGKRLREIVYGDETLGVAPSPAPAPIGG